MKLEDWYEQNSAALSKGDLSQKYQDALRDKYVIGTCGDCKWWKQEGNDGWGKCCGNSEGGIFGDAQIGVTGYTFGCIHWEKKND